ncbi:MAG: hypothetical protein ACO3JZ_09675, partial [Schleiferiaceae bacterium]
MKKHGWIVLAAIFIIIIIGALLPSKGTVEILDNEDPVVEAEPKFYLTLPADTLRFEDHTIASGESFGALLGKRGISTAQIYQIAAAVEPVFNVRKIRAGVTVKFATGDSSLFPSYFIYPESTYEYYIVSLQSDSIYAKKVEKERSVRR